MTLKKWLKKIALFPLSVIMAVPGDGESSDTDFDADTLREIAGPDERPLNERIMAFAGNPNAQFMPVTNNPDAAASEDSDQSADSDGKQGEDADSDGLSTSEEDDQDADLDAEEDEDTDDSTSQETDESGEGKKGLKQKKFDERVAEVAAKIVEEKLAAKQTAEAQEAPDFAPPEMVRSVKLNIVRKQAMIRELEADIDLEGDEVDPDKVDQLLALQDFVTEARQALKENEQKEKAWKERQAAKRVQTDNGDAIRKELDDTAELYRAEMQINPATWDKMGKWFEQQINTKPLLVTEFNDIYAKKGKVAAIRFAHEYAVKNMGQKTKQVNEQKEKSKTKAASLTASSTGKQAPPDLRKIQAEFAANPTDENFVRLQAAKRELRKAA